LTEEEYARFERAVYQVTSAESDQVASLECSWYFISSDGGQRIKELITLAIKAWDPDQRLMVPLDELIEWIPANKEAGY
jgi:hypothetical protein